MAKCIDSRKNNFTKYCKAINVYGKRILVKFLKWFYKGGDKNYLEYLNSEYRYSLRDMDRLIDASHADYLKHKTPEAFDMTLIHTLLLLACNLFEEIDSSEPGYELVERGIETLVSQSQCVNAGRMKPSLSDSELEDKLYGLRKLYEGLIMTGGTLSGVNKDEVQDLFDETCFGVMCLNSYIEKFNPSFVKEKKVLYNEDLVMKIEKIEKEFEKISKPKTKDMPEFYKDIAKAMKWKTKMENLEPIGDDDGLRTNHNAKIQGDTASSKMVQVLIQKNLGKSTSVEKQTSSKKSDSAEKKVSSHDSMIQSAVVQANSTSNISGSRQDTSIDSNIVDNTNVSFDKSSEKISMHSIISPAVHDFYKNKKETAIQGTPPSSLYSDTNLLLKQHQKYSRKPGQQVKLKDLFNVEGMNDEVAEIIIVSGEAGMGKSLLLNYISEKWRYDQDAVEKLDHYNVLHTDLKNNDYSNFNELASSLLKINLEKLGTNAELIKETFLDMRVLLTLDSYDESAEKSCQLVKEVLQMSGSDFRIIITSRPQYVDSIYKQISKSRRKHVSHLSLNGIPSTHHADFVSRFIDNHNIYILRDKSTREEVKEGLISILPDIYMAIGEDLCNPLMLTIITAMWIEKTGSCDVL